ncbi:chemokine-like receptor 1 [Colossoma macropomum]|uniref:chemokine-like receptor 1 n=1 Tax=Colossoma macropomum TaxID=42526 RepID=UPI00186462E1|nr:chemokine-like receptor 1 [Colossoma macropomum]
MTSAPVTEEEHLGPRNENNTTNPTMASPTCKDAMCIFFAAANLMIFILGVVGNGLVIWIAGFKLKKSVIITWYLSLAMSDFILCAFLPIGIIDMLKNEWVFDYFMCKFWSFFTLLNMYSSIFLLVIISVDRCVVVMFPVWAQNQRTIKKASVAVVLAWLISAALSAQSVVLDDVEHDHLDHTTFCFYSHINDQNHFAEVACELIFGFLIPFLVIIVCYVAIVRKLKSNQMPKFKKPFKIMTVLVATSLICWVPYHTVALMDLNYEKYKSFLPTAYVVVIILASANSALNPYLYAFMGKDFKIQCNALLSKIESAVKEDL